MNDTIQISGRVKFPIMLDPGVWIFDDRKLDLTTYFDEEQTEVDELEQYTKEVSAHWSREIQEGAAYPPTLKTEKKFEKQKIMNGTFGIAAKPFIENAEPEEGAEYVTFVTAKERHTFPIDEAKKMIFWFSRDGKPFREDGPAYLVDPSGSNRENPIRQLREIVIS